METNVFLTRAPALLSEAAALLRKSALLKDDAWFDDKWKVFDQNIQNEEGEVAWHILYEIAQKEIDRDKNAKIDGNFWKTMFLIADHYGIGLEEEGFWHKIHELTKGKELDENFWPVAVNYIEKAGSGIGREVKILGS